MAPRIVSSKSKALLPDVDQELFEVTRIVHEFKEYQRPFSIVYVAKIYGKEVSFEPRR